MKLLKELLTYHNPRRAQYEELIAETRILYTSYGEGKYCWERDLKRDHHKLLQDKLKGGLLVDLGCGYHSNDWVGMVSLAKYSGAKAYIGVDRAFSSRTSRFKNLASPEMEAEYDPMQLVLVCEDMLRFLARLPDQSVNIAIGFIDSCIIPSPPYHLAVAKEIERVTPEGGIVLACVAEPIRYLSGDIFTKERSRAERNFDELGPHVFVKK